MESLCTNDGLFEIKVGVDGEHALLDDALALASGDGGGIQCRVVFGEQRRRLRLLHDQERLLSVDEMLDDVAHQFVFG